MFESRGWNKGMKIGFVGLGTMGRPMALNLLKAGHELRVYNRTREKMTSLVAEGAQAASSYADAARECEVVVTVLSDSPVVREVVLEDSGILGACTRGTIIVDMSTMSPAVTTEIARECKKVGVELVDAPVSGGEGGAIAGTLSIMVGGSRSALETVRPILETMGSKIPSARRSGFR